MGNLLDRLYMKRKAREDVESDVEKIALRQKNDADCGGRPPKKASCDHQRKGIKTNDDAVSELHLAVSEEWTVEVEEEELPILTAARNGDFATASHLLDQDPNLQLADSDRNTVLHLACSSHCVELVSYLLENTLLSTDISAANNKENTALHSLMIGKNLPAVEQNLITCLQKLLQKGANINSKNENQETPLYLAARAKLPRVVKKLMESGADPTIISRDGRSVLHAACHSGSHESLSFLLQSKETGNLVLMEDDYGFAPFHIAVSSYSINCCEILLQNGDHLAERDSQDRSRCSLILNHMPSSSSQALLEKIFDSNVEVSKNERWSSDFYVKMDFSVLFNLVEGMEDSVISCLPGSESEPLVKHPLIESYLFLKWSRVQYFFYCYICCFFFFLAVHTFYVMKTFTMLSTWQDEDNMLMMVYCAHVGLLLLILIPSTIITFANKREYFRQWETYVKFVAISAACYVVFSTDSHSTEKDVGANVAAVSIFLNWVEFMMLLGRLPFLGVYILMFTRVAKSIIIFILAFSSLIIGFLLSFVILLKNVDVFKSTFTGFVKVLLMMIGEIDYSEIYEKTRNSSTANLVISHLFLVVFLFLIPIILTNLLIGVAVSDLHELQNHGRLRRLVKQAAYLETCETMLFVFKKWLCFPNKIVVLLSKLTLITEIIQENPPVLKIFPVKDHKNRIPSATLKTAIDLGLKKRKTDFAATFDNFLKGHSDGGKQFVRQVLSQLIAPEMEVQSGC